MSNNVGRPKTENKQTQDIDINALIEQVTKSVTDKLKTEYEGKIAELQSKVDSKVEVSDVKKSSNQKYKNISDDTTIIIKSNIGGGFVFKEDRGKIRSYVLINDYDETYPLPYDEFKLLLTTGNTFLKSGKIAIVDVIGDATVEDVILNSKLDGLYYNPEKISPSEINKLFESNYDVKEFRKFVTNSTEILEAILETAYALFKKGKFSDNDKMNVLRQIFGKHDLFL